MSTFQIKKATKTQARLRMAIHGPSGCGKTFSALRIARALAAPGKRVCLIDTERGSASKYADKFDFDVIELSDDNYAPSRVGEMLTQIAEAGYDVAIVDSMTHFWNGNGGFLNLVDQEVIKMKAKGNKPDSFAAWKQVDPIYQRMVHAIHMSPMHVIVTLRAKMEYAKVEGDNGKTRVQKVGLAPEMRDNFQYEMDVEGMLDLEHNLAIGKTRCDAIDGMVFRKPGEDIASALRTWLSTGAPRALTDHERLCKAFAEATDATALEALRTEARALFAAGKISKANTEHLVTLNTAALARIAVAAPAAASSTVAA